MSIDLSPEFEKREELSSKLRSLRSQRSGRVHQATYGNEFDRLKRNRVLRRERQIEARAKYLFGR